METIYDVAVIGGGPAGMMAAIAAAEERKKVCLLERNEGLGAKLLLTGKGRCNLTTTKSINEIVANFGPRGKFLRSALSKFSNLDLVNFFEERGIKTKVERDERVFPQDDQAISVLNCLKKELEKNRVQIIFKFRTIKLKKQEEVFKIFSDNSQTLFSKKVIIATGGKSYPETGSTGDGYRLAKDFGHRISPLKPALTPLFVKDEEIRKLAGLDLNNINLTVIAGGLSVGSVFGDMIFTHQGVSGPIILSESKKIYELISERKEVFVSIDLKPALDREKLKNRINRDVLTMARKEYQTLLAGLLPQSLIPLAVKKTKIDEHKKIGDLRRGEKEKLIDFLKNFSFKIDGVAPIEVSIVTAGGVEIDEINQSTMESKIISGLYFVGEIIGLDGPTGGFNLTKAFSTGWIAGKSAGGSEN